jgi:hypothetical protein
LHLQRVVVRAEQAKAQTAGGNAVHETA